MTEHTYIYCMFCYSSGNFFIFIHCMEALNKTKVFEETIKLCTLRYLKLLLLKEIKRRNLNPRISRKRECFYYGKHNYFYCFENFNLKLKNGYMKLKTIKCKSFWILNSFTLQTVHLCLKYCLLSITNYVGS